jgi:hypothetical protein
VGRAPADSVARAGDRLGDGAVLQTFHHESAVPQGVQSPRLTCPFYCTNITIILVIITNSKGGELMARLTKVLLTTVLLCLCCFVPFGISMDQSVQPEQAMLASMDNTSHYDAVLKEATNLVYSPISIFIFYCLLFIMLNPLFPSKFLMPHLYAFAAMFKLLLLLFPIKYKSRYLGKLLFV